MTFWKKYLRMRDLPDEKEKCEREGEKETGLVENPPPLHSYLILIKNFLSTTKANAALREIPSNVPLWEKKACNNFVCAVTLLSGDHWPTFPNVSLQLQNLNNFWNIFIKTLFLFFTCSLHRRIPSFLFSPLQLQPFNYNIFWFPCSVLWQLWFVSLP